MTNGQRVALVLGITAAIIGLVLSLTPVRAEGVDCGNVWSRKTAQPLGTSVGDYYLANIDNARCDDPLSNRRIAAAGTGIAGLVFVVGSVITGKPKPTVAAPPSAEETTL